jgi:hypothetical protein
MRKIAARCGGGGDRVGGGGERKGAGGGWQRKAWKRREGEGGGRRWRKQRRRGEVGSMRDNERGGEESDMQQIIRCFV